MEPARAIKSLASPNRLSVEAEAAEKMGVIFLFETGLLRASYVDKLAFFTIGEPPITANLTVVYKKNAFLSPAARTFIDLIKKQYQAFDRMA